MALFIVANFCMGCGSGGDGPVPSELTTNFPATVFALANMVSCSSGFVAPYVIGAILESGAGDLQYLWRCVFYLAAGFAACGITVFVAFGSAKIQPWDGPSELVGARTLGGEDTDDEGGHHPPDQVANNYIYLDKLSKS